VASIISMETVFEITPLMSVVILILLPEEFPSSRTAKAYPSSFVNDIGESKLYF